MKFSEAMAKLEENRELKFKDQYGFIVSLNENGYLVLKRNGVTTPLDWSLKVASSQCLKADNWTVIQESVEFMAAANSGKRIKYEGWDGYYFLHEALHILQNCDGALGLINGKWHVE